MGLPSQQSIGDTLNLRKAAQNRTGNQHATDSHNVQLHGALHPLDQRTAVDHSVRLTRSHARQSINDTLAHYYWLGRAHNDDPSRHLVPDWQKAYRIARTRTVARVRNQVESSAAHHHGLAGIGNGFRSDARQRIGADSGAGRFRKNPAQLLLRATRNHLVPDDALACDARSGCAALSVYNGQHIRANGPHDL